MQQEERWKGTIGLIGKQKAWAMKHLNQLAFILKVTHEIFFRKCGSFAFWNVLWYVKK
jgi:hypothetical protein